MASLALAFDILAKDKASGPLKTVGDNVDRTGDKVGGFGSKLSSMSGKVKAGFAGLAVGAGALAVLGNEVLTTGAKLEAWRTKTNTVFEGAAGAVRKWADSNNEAFGLTDDELAGLAASFGDLLKPMGFTADQAADMSTKVVGLSGALSSWSGGTRSAAEVSDILAKAMLGERDGLKELGISISDADVDARLLAKGQDKLTGSALEQAKALATQELIFEKSTDAQKAYAEGGNKALTAQNKLKAALGELREQMAEKLLPIALKVAEWAGAQLPKVMSIAKNAFNSIKPFVASVIAGFGKLVNAFKVLMGDDGPQGFGEIMDNLLGNSGKYVDMFRSIGETIRTVVGFIRDNFKPILIGLGVAFAVLISPVGALVAALVFVYARFKIVRDVVGAVVGFLTTVALPAIVSFAAFVAEQFSHLADWVRLHWAAIEEAISHVIRAVSEVIGVAVDWISTIWRAWGDDLMRVVGGAWDFIRETVENAINLVRSIIETVVALINGDWGKAWDGIKGIASAVWNQIYNIVSTAINLVKSIIGGVLSTIAQVWSGVWNGLSGAVAGAWNAIYGVVSTKIVELVGLVSGLPGLILSAVGDLGSLLKDVGRQLIDGFIRGIKEKFETVKNKLGELKDKLTSWKGPPAEDAVLLVGAGQLVMDGFIRGIADRTGAVRQALGGVTSMIEKMAAPQMPAVQLATVARGNRPTLALTETVVPPGRGGGLAPQITLINHGVLSGEQDVMRWIAEGLRAHDRALA